MLAALIVQLLAATRLYATAAILIGLAALAARDLKRAIWGSEHRLLWAPAQSAAITTARWLTTPSLSHVDSGTAPPLRQLEREQQLQFAEALLDTVTAALFVIRDDGTLVLVNRSARRLAGEPVSAFHQIEALGATTADLLTTMQPGARQVAYLADGQPMYVSATEFRGAGHGKQRLISLQRIAGELDAIEVKAWQDVARVLTHEMMNSLTPIASLSENLEQLLREARHTGAPAVAAVELSGALEAIKRRSQGLMSFVERYRAVAEVPEPHLRPVDMEQFFAAIDRLMGTMLREQGIAYRRCLTPVDLSIVADAELLEQAVINLVRNAGEAAAGASTPMVSVVCELRDGELIIAVADNGCGLSEQQREQIFVPFYTTKPDGSGIGLSLARQITFAHRGRVEVAANPPQGSIFSIVLPSAQLEPKAQAAAR